MSLRVVLDSNISISGLLFGGVPGAILDAAAEKLFLSVTSSSILAELQGKLSGKLKKSPEEVVGLMGIIRRMSEVAEPSQTFNICRDPKDDHVLECAVTAQADVIVTGDKDLLILSPFRGVRILTPRQFYDEFVLSSAAQPLP